MAEAMFPGEALPEVTSGGAVQSENARRKANQEEISRLVERLPSQVREQLDELFRARYTRIEKVKTEPEAAEPDSK